MQTPIFLGTGNFFNGIAQHGGFRLNLLRSVYVSGLPPIKLSESGRGQSVTRVSKCVDHVYSESLKNWTHSLTGCLLQPSASQSFAMMPSFPPRPPRGQLALICIQLSLMLYSLDSASSFQPESELTFRRVLECTDESLHAVDWL